MKRRPKRNRKTEKRRVVRSFDALEPIAVSVETSGEQWRLYTFTIEKPDKPPGPWRNLALVPPPRLQQPQERTRGKVRQGRTRYYAGWNGMRFAANADTKLLRKRHPEMMKWLRDVCPTIAAINDQQRAQA